MVLLFITSWELTLVMIAVVPALVGIAVMYGRFTKKLTKDYQDALAKAAGTCIEVVIKFIRVDLFLFPCRNWFREYF